MLSTTVKNADDVEALPQSSMAMNIAVTAKPFSHPSSMVSVMISHEIEPHASSTTAPPWLSNQLAKSSSFPFPSHSTVRFWGCSTYSGCVVSWMVNVAVVFVSLPQLSVATKVTSADPANPQIVSNDAKLLVHVMALHSSSASAPPFASSQIFNAS